MRGKVKKKNQTSKYGIFYKKRIELKLLGFGIVPHFFKNSFYHFRIDISDRNCLRNCTTLSWDSQ